MTRLSRDRSTMLGRPALVTVGAIYTLLGAGYEIVPWTESTLSVDIIVFVLVAGPGLLLLAAAIRLPGFDISQTVHPIITRWVLGGIGVMAALVGFVALSGEMGNIGQNLLILTALGSTAGLAAGTYDARARSRTITLERRNEELQETKSELESTLERLRTSEQRYRTLAENFPNGAVALLDEDLRHEVVAGRGLIETDIEPGELQGKLIYETYSDRIVEQIEPRYRATLDGEPQTFELEMRGRTYEFRSHPLTSDGADPDSILVMTQDVTHRLEHERQLARRAQQQRTIADLGQRALETDDLDALMAHAARRVSAALDTDYCKVLDLRENDDELLLRQGVGWDEGIVGEATVSATETDSQAAYTLEHEQPIVVEDLATETRFSGPDLLTDHDVESGISTVIGPFDEPWGILGTHDTEAQTFTDEDVSFVQSVSNILAEAIEREQYERELERVIADLEQSNERLEQFAYAASHDLQEPLRMVSSYLQLIESRYADELDEEGVEFLEFAVDGAERMRSMIDGLLKYSRVESKADPFERVDLDAVLSAVRDDLQVTIEETDATISADSLPTVEGDERQLRQVLQNLLENAIAYSGDEPPCVHVSAERDETDWIVSVEDEGTGIDPGQQDRIFEVFERAHGRDEYDGTGIGLALCNRIVERHGGDIWVESDRGDGATFSFTLPAVGVAETAVPNRQ